MDVLCIVRSKLINCAQGRSVSLNQILKVIAERNVPRDYILFHLPLRNERNDTFSLLIDVLYSKLYTVNRKRLVESR